MGLLKQSTARKRLFLMVDSVDHLTGKTGLTVTLTLSKDGGAFAAAGGAVTELTSGWYYVSLNTTDTNTLGDLAFHATAAGADPSDWVDEVSARITDDLSAPGTAQTITANQSVNVAQWNGTNVAAPATAGIPKVAIEAAGDFAQAAADKVWSTATRALTDKVGFALSAAGVQAIWDAATSALTTVGSIGKLLVDNLNAQISSRMATFTLPTNFSLLSINGSGLVDITQAAADKVWSTTTRALTDKINFALSASGVQAIWDALTANLTTANSIGKRLADDIDATISSRSTYAGGAVASVTGSVGSVAAGGITSASFGVGAVDAAALATDAVNEIRDALLTATVDGATTLQESLRLQNSALGGKVSGLAAGAPVFRDLADTKDRITATTDVDGNRTAVSRNLT